MNRNIYLRCALSLSLCSLLFACKPAGEKKDEKPSEAHATESTNAESGLKIDAETQARMGLKVEAISESQYRPELKCFGHVLDAAPLHAAFNEIKLAKANLALTQKELERLKILKQQNNASERALQTAEAAYERDRLSFEAARQKLQLGWGKEISKRTDLSEIVAKLAAGENSLLRLDFPLDEKPASIPEHIRFALVSEPETLSDADALGVAPVVDPTTQGPGYFFLAKAGYDKLPVNSIITAQWPQGTAALQGFLIPAGAIVLHDGEKWFFRQSGEAQFQRERIEQATSGPSGYFITNGVSAGERIVTLGAQQLLSEELKSQIKPD